MRAMCSSTRLGQASAPSLWVWGRRGLAKTRACSVPTGQKQLPRIRCAVYAWTVPWSTVPRLYAALFLGCAWRDSQHASAHVKSPQKLAAMQVSNTPPMSMCVAGVHIFPLFCPMGPSSLRFTRVKACAWRESQHALCVACVLITCHWYIGIFAQADCFC